MTQLSFDDMWQEPEAVYRSEQGAKTGEQLKEQAEQFYRKNPELLAAHIKAAKVFEDAGADVSARNLTVFARSFKLVGLDGVRQLAEIYAELDWERDEPYAISDQTSSWLTRYLERNGFKVTKAKAKQDEIDERNSNADGRQFSRAEGVSSEAGSVGI